jgi:hypothetical protein
MLATDRCPNPANELFSEGSEPSEYCNVHKGKPLMAPPPPSPAEKETEAADEPEPGAPKGKPGVP